MGRKEGGGMQFGALSLIARGGGYFESLREGRGGGMLLSQTPLLFPFYTRALKNWDKKFCFINNKRTFLCQRVFGTFE